MRIRKYIVISIVSTGAILLSALWQQGTAQAETNLPPPPYCQCSFTIKTKVANLPPAKPASDGPKFGYGDIKDQCNLAFKAFGNLVATDQGSDGTMCGGYCSSVGKTCPLGQKCLNNQDCASGVCNAGFCANSKGFGGDEKKSCSVELCDNKFNCQSVQDVNQCKLCTKDADCPSGYACKTSEEVPDSPAACTPKDGNLFCFINKLNCKPNEQCINDVCVDSTADGGDAITVQNCTDSNYAKSQFGTDVDGKGLPCGGYCGAYYGKKCPNNSQCKVNADCQSGICNAPANPDDTFGYCSNKPATEEEGTSNSSTYDEGQTIIKQACFFPQQISCSYSTKIDESSCDIAAKDPIFLIQSDPLKEVTHTLCILEQCSLDSQENKCYQPVTTPPPAYKEEPFIIPDASGLNKLGTTDVKVVIGRVIKAGMGIMGSLALVMFIYGGILWMVSRGESDKADKARQILMWGTLGVVVIFSSYALLDIVFEVFR